MKIFDWNKLEKQGFKQTKTGYWKKNGVGGTYYKKRCKECNEWFLGQKKSEFCSNTCAKTGKNNNFYGKHHTNETKKLIGESNKNKYHTEECKEKLSKKMSGKNSPMYGMTGEKHPTWKGGYREKGLAYYNTYAPQLEWCEKVRRSPIDENILEVRCFKCGEWYIPNINNVRANIRSINNNDKGENHFYCSDECKHSCSIYHKKPESIMKEDTVRAGRLDWLKLDRELQPELRKMVLERDGYQCVKCSSDVGQLYCHHIYPVSTNPIESADIDNCITLCIDCHKESHQKDGCRIGQLKTCIEYK
jgi:hypothetical protein